MNMTGINNDYGVLKFNQAFKTYVEALTFDVIQPFGTNVIYHVSVNTSDSDLNVDESTDNITINQVMNSINSQLNNDTEDVDETEDYQFIYINLISDNDYAEEIILEIEDEVAMTLNLLDESDFHLIEFYVRGLVDIYMESESKKYHFNQTFFN